MKKIDDEKIKLIGEFIDCLSDSCNCAVNVVDSDDELDDVILILDSACSSLYYFLKSKNKDNK